MISNVLFRIAWATVAHMSHEGGDGMKLRDLARGSGNPTSVMPAFYMFWSRSRNQETSRLSRKSYESVPSSSSVMRFLTSLQQAAMVHVLRIFHRPRHLGSTVAFPVRTHNRHQNLRPRACRRPASLHFLIFE